MTLVRHLIPAQAKADCAARLREAAAAAEDGDIAALASGIIAAVAVAAKAADTLGKQFGIDAKPILRQKLQEGLDKIFGGP